MTGSRSNEIIQKKSYRTNGGGLCTRCALILGGCAPAVHFRCAHFLLNVYKGLRELVHENMCVWFFSKIFTPVTLLCHSKKGANMYHNLTELLTKEFPPESLEQAYRRGYRDGAMVAISDLSDILGKLSRGKNRKTEQYFRWAEEVLHAWEHKAESENRVELPPVYKRGDSNAVC